jgi:hypothetical protein
LLNDLVYVEPAKAVFSAPLPAVDLGAPLTRPPNAGALIQFNGGVEQPHDSSSAFQLPTEHVSFDRPLISLAQGFAPVAPDPAASALSPSELILTTSIAGREVISVLGDSLPMHFAAGMSDADKGVFLNGLAKHAATASSADASSGTSAGPPAPSSPHSSSGTSSAPANSELAPSTTDGPSSGAYLNTQIAAATKVIIQFEGAHPDYGVIDSGKEVVIYDTHLTSSNYSTAVQENFSFSDGSSIVLVGLPPSHESPLVS